MPTCTRSPRTRCATRSGRPSLSPGAPSPPEALDLAVTATRGYPFLIQLIGHRASNASPDQATITVDTGPSRISDIAQRLDVDTNYANQYRRRLIAAEMITPAGRGLITFTLPYLGEYLIDHPVTDAFSD